MKKILIVAGCLFMSCLFENPTKPVDMLPLDHNPIRMKMGDSWLYKRLFINIADSGSWGGPDTLVGYAYYVASKDTTINSLTYLIVDGKEYDIEKDTISIYKQRYAIHFSDTVFMYEFDTGEKGWYGGVMKRCAFKNSIRKNASILELRKFNLSKLLAATNYDSAVYKDFVFPIMFPLSIDSVYVFRPANDIRQNLPYRYKFKGIENITNFSGTQQAYKYELLIQEAFATIHVFGLDSTHLYTWIGANGLLRRYFDFGYSDMVDDLGAPTGGKIRSWEIHELIGTQNINPDTLKPWGRR